MAAGGQPYTYPVKAVDPDSDPLTYSLGTKPTGMSIDAATGLISWAPSSSDGGQHDVTVRVDDGRGGFDTQSYTIDVTAAAPGKIEGTVFNDLDGNGVWDKGRFLLSSENTNSILEFDGSTGDFVGYFVPPGSGGLFRPNVLIFGPDGDLYVDSYNGGDDVLRFDGVTGAFISTFVAPGSGGLRSGALMAFGPDGDLYIANTEGDDVLRYDGTTGAFLGTFITPASGGPLGPDSLNFRPDGYLYTSMWEALGITTC
jgi:sugar lactone lactonase YvrE